MNYFNIEISPAAECVPAVNASVSAALATSLDALIDAPIIKHDQPQLINDVVAMLLNFYQSIGAIDAWANLTTEVVTPEDGVSYFRFSAMIRFRITDPMVRVEWTRAVPAENDEPVQFDEPVVPEATVSPVA